jgi:integrase
MPRLTTAAIERYRATRKRRELRDAAVRGLYLVLQPTGAKSFALRFNRPDGRPAKLTLGSYTKARIKLPDEPMIPEIGADLTLEDAHLLAAQIHRERRAGIDVITAHSASKQQRAVQKQQDAATTYPLLLRQFIAEHAQPKTRRWRRAARLLGLNYPADGGEPTVIPGGLCDRWARKPVGEISSGDIYQIVEETRRIGAPGLRPARARGNGLSDAMGRAMHAALSPFFTWAIRHRHITSNPAFNVRPDAPKHRRDRVLTEAEIASFWKATDQLGSPVGQLMKLLLLTGARREEVRGMRYSELSDDGATWTIPGARAKNRHTLVLPLPKLAQEILRSVKRISGSDYVFTLSGSVPVNLGSHCKQQLEQLMSAPPWTVHDLRRTAATQMCEIGIAPHIVEAVLNHVSGHKAGVAGIYNHAQHKDAKAAALERWGAHIQSVVADKPAKNVVALARKRGK